MWPIRIDGVLCDPMGRPWIAPAPYPGTKPGGIASRARKIHKPDPEQARYLTRWSKIYWAAFKIANKEKIELMEYQPPG